MIFEQAFVWSNDVPVIDWREGGIGQLKKRVVVILLVTIEKYNFKVKEAFATSCAWQFLIIN